MQVQNSQDITYEFILSRLTDLPTLPTVVAQLTQILNDPMASTNDVVDIVEKDQALTTKLLKLINSGYFSMSQKVEKLDRAIALLGFNQVNQVVISTSVIQNFSVFEAKQFNPIEFWKHSLGAAIVAESLAISLNVEDPATFFTAGLIHDIGKLTLLKIVPKAFLKIMQFAVDHSISFERAEAQLEMVKHEVVGQLLAQKWRLHLDLQNAIKYHHKTSLVGRDFLSSDTNLLIDVITLANMIIHELNFGNSGHNFKYDYQPVALRLHIDRDAIDKMRNSAVESLQRAESFLSLITGTS